MTDFNPGDGWREWNFDTDRGRALSRERVQWTDASGFDHFFVRVGPVPPLPTEPGAVIQWQDGAYLPQIAQLDPGDRHLGWWAPDDHGDPRWMTAERLQCRIGSDKWTLLEPRAVTAKAVLDDVRTIRDIARGYGGTLDAIGRDFGVES